MTDKLGPQNCPKGHPCDNSGKCRKRNCPHRKKKAKSY